LPSPPSCRRGRATFPFGFLVRGVASPTPPPHPSSPNGCCLPRIRRQLGGLGKVASPTPLDYWRGKGCCLQVAFGFLVRGVATPYPYPYPFGVGNFPLRGEGREGEDYYSFPLGRRRGE